MIYSQIMANQSADGIDTVSGATYSSEGILDAAQKALGPGEELNRVNVETAINI